MQVGRQAFSLSQNGGLFGLLSTGLSQAGVGYGDSSGVGQQCEGTGLVCVEGPATIPNNTQRAKGVIAGSKWSGSAVTGWMGTKETTGRNN